MSNNQTHAHLFQRPENVELEQAVSLLMSNDQQSAFELQKLYERSSAEKEMKKSNSNSGQPINIK